ncbi:MAG: OmpA family protein [Candidatus Zixiibacteriota bacterium]
MKRMLGAVLFSVLFLGACGAKKDYVDKQVADAEARSNARMAQLSSQSDSTAAEVVRLGQLSQELSRKTDLALNQASGFENYEIVWQGEITFGFDRYDLDGVAQQILDDAGAKLNATSHSIIEIAGHTDATGPSTYNYTLGERRASAAKRYLADRYGVGLYRMFIISYGKDKLVSLPDQRQGNAKNRRVVLKVWAPKQIAAQ